MIIEVFRTIYNIDDFRLIEVDDNYITIGFKNYVMTDDGETKSTERDSVVIDADHESDLSDIIYRHEELTCDKWYRNTIMWRAGDKIKNLILEGLLKGAKYINIDDAYPKIVTDIENEILQEFKNEETIGEENENSDS